VARAVSRRRSQRQSDDKGESETGLSPEVRAPIERAYGQSFGDVKVHQNSSRAGGSVHALAEGNDLHFAPGKFNPGTQQGNWLVAHELAHVAQQRGGGMSAQAFDSNGGNGLLEQDADRSADKAMRGESAAPRFHATAGSTQRFESWEHNKLGEAGGGGRSITTKSGVVITYGQAVALSGDFYATPEALMNAPKEELEKLLATMKNETAEADNPEGKPTDKQEDENNAKYQDATQWREDTHYDETGHDTGKTEGEAQGSDSKSYLSLADDNSSHFSPNNIQQRWRPQHEQAMSLAAQAFKADQDEAAQQSNAQGGEGGNAQGANANAGQQGPQQGPQGGAEQGANAGAEHGEPKEGQEAQAANQIAQQGGEQGGDKKKEGGTPEPSPADVQAQASDGAVNMKSQQGRDLLNQAQLHNAFGCHFITDAFASGHLISGDVGRQVGEQFWSANQSRVAGALKSAANADNPHVPHQAVDAAIAGVMELVKSHAGSLCLKLVHDKLNATPLTVTNPRGDTWQTMGDGSLAGTPGSQQFGAEAVALSRRSLEEMASTGNCADPEKALSVVPHLVAFQGDSLTIEQFATNPTIFQGFLEPLLLDPSPTNPLYLKIKSNLGLAGQMAGQKVHQAGQAVGAAGKRAKSAVTGWVDSLFDK
jgi:hypothetical protein